VRVTKPGVRAGATSTTIFFQGEQVPARPGESVAAALVASGHYACRETREGTNRGLFCGMGVCNECALTIDGAPGHLACMEKVAAGMAVSLCPAVRPLPAGEACNLPEDERAVEVLVVGAGPAGLSAALAARQAGAGVLVVDERHQAGGQFFKQPVASPGLGVEARLLDSQYRSGLRLLEEVARSGADLLTGVRVWGHDGPNELYALAAGRRMVLRPRALVLATGAFERAAPFPGWTLPGVMTTGAAQTLLRSYLVAPGRSVLISGNGPLNLQVAAELVEVGAKVVAVAEAAALWHPGRAVHLARMASSAPSYLLRGASYLATLRRARVPLLARSAVVEVRGDGRAEKALVARLDRTGRPVPGSRRTFEVDAVCVGYGFVPSSELARSLGCRQGYSRGIGPWVEADRRGRTSVPGVWVVGDGGRVGGAEVAQATGTLAGLDVAESLGHRPGPALEVTRRRAERALARAEAFQRGLGARIRAPTLIDQLATPETLVCRCEEVTLAQLLASAKPWLAAAGSIKRVSRAGMGKCQGRYCSPVLVELAARISGAEPGPRSGFAPQAPFSPTPLSAVASPSGPGACRSAGCPV
jgi:NADPH-dependent 2,4-dienoyl-CoA reductase/sulfur reductase-like enzyme